MTYPTIGSIRSFEDVRKALERLRAFFISEDKAGIGTITLVGAIKGSGQGTIITALSPAGLDDVFHDESGYLRKVSTGVYELVPFASAETLTIAGGIATITDTGAEEYYITLKAQSGVTGTLNEIQGLANLKKVFLKAYSGHTITVTRGAYLNMPSNFTLSGNRRIVFESDGGNVCSMLSSAANL
jgi:hypothetical protein